MKRFWGLLVLIVFLIIIDQLTKGYIQTSFVLGENVPVIEGLLNITYAKNPGAAFSFMATAGEIPRKFMFLLIPTLFSFWIFYMIIKTIKGPYYLSLAYALIFAGAVGNLIDRFSMGYVVDFILVFRHPYYFPVFNVADSCISIAAGLLIWDLYVQMKLKKKEKTASIEAKS